MSIMDVGRASILLISPEMPMLHLLRLHLDSEAYDVRPVSTAAQGLQTAQIDLPDLVICDQHMPDMRWSQVCQRLLDDTRTRHIPIIVLGSLPGSQPLREVLETGADEYLARPIDFGLLAARIVALIRRARLKPAVSPLTGLPGNLVIEQELRRRTEPGAGAFAALYIDLNNFKAYNDVYGFAAGDEAIRMTARVIVAAAHEHGGPADLVGHVGGDDFVVLTRPDRSEPIANRIVAEFDHQVSELYTPADRRRGYITAKDRQGILRKYALLSIAVAIVHNEYRDVTSHYEVAEIGAELKLFAKSRGGSMVVKDQRHV
ncbi:MAG: diguanylate cyclase [Anaerolineales bacterium]|nr:diguanylate cyclase [Anaerolineales bacterium]